MRRITRFDPWIIRGTIMIPSALAVAQFAWILAIAHRLPTRMATHWDAAGNADGFMTPAQSALTLLVVTVACAQIGWFGARTASPLIVRRSTAVASLLLTGFLLGVNAGVTIPQFDLEDPSSARIGWGYAIAGAALGLAAGLFVAGCLRDYSTLTDAPVTSRPSPTLPRGHKTGRLTVTCSQTLKILVAVWTLGSIALALFLPVLGIIFLLCVPLFLLGYSSGIEVKDDEIDTFTGAGPIKIHQRIDMRTVKYAEAGTYHWADGGGVGLRFGNDGRISVAARSGEAVKIETSGAGYTVVVPDGMAELVAGDINARLDAARS